MREIYFDNAATTKPLKPAVDAMLAAAAEFGNPSSLHKRGVEAEKLITSAAEQIAGIINSSPSEVYFNSGGTEGNNTAVFGVVRASARKKNIISTVSEHPSVISAFNCVKNEAETVFLPVSEDGLISIPELTARINNETALVSIIHVNNETGVTQDIEAIGRAVKKANPRTLFHVDAVQGFCKTGINVVKSKIDLMSISAHKIHGLKGCGALYIRKGVIINPLIYGGSQQNSVRPGTQNVTGIAAFGAAAKEFNDSRDKNLSHVADIKDRFSMLAESMEGCYINGGEGSPYIINMSFLGVKPETLLSALSAEGIYISAGAACSSKGNKHDLSYLGIGEARAQSAVRFSFSVENTIEEAEYAAGRVKEIVSELRKVTANRG